MQRNRELVFVVLVLTFAIACAELVQWRPCPYPDPDAPSNCTIHEVILDPCKESAQGKPCKLKRGLIGNMTFHYTPAFSGEKIQGRVYWASQVMDIPFMGMDPDACLATTCPIVAGSRNTYRTGIAILKKYPIRMYDLKWKIWNEEEQECCFMFEVKITK